MVPLKMLAIAKVIHKNISLKNFLFRVYIIQYRIDSENIQQS